MPVTVSRMRKKPDHTRDEAIELRGKGVSPRAIAGKLRVSEAWVRLVTKGVKQGELNPDAGPPTPRTLDPLELANLGERTRKARYAEPAPDAPAPPPAPKAKRPPKTVLELAQETYDRARDTAEQAQADGNTPARQRAERDMLAAAETVRKATKSLGDDADLVKYPRKVLDDAMRSAAERVRVLCAVPLQCSDCGRALRVNLASSVPDPGDSEER